MKYSFLVLFYIFLDQITKLLIVINIPYDSAVKFNDYLNVVNVSNTGVAFSMFQGQNVFFSLFTLLVVSAVILFAKKHFSEFSLPQMHALLLIIGGGFGNLADRIFRGAVVDFIDIGYKTVYRWPAFNIADSCVCIGVTLFIISTLLSRTKKT